MNSPEPAQLHKVLTPTEVPKAVLYLRRPRDAPVDLRSFLAAYAHYPGSFKKNEVHNRISDHLAKQPWKYNGRKDIEVFPEVALRLRCAHRRYPLTVVDAAALQDDTLLLWGIIAPLTQNALEREDTQLQRARAYFYFNYGDQVRNIDTYIVADLGCYETSTSKSELQRMDWRYIPFICKPEYRGILSRVE
jgi:hypothetical protein